MWQSSWRLRDRRPRSQGGVDSTPPRPQNSQKSPAWLGLIMKRNYSTETFILIWEINWLAGWLFTWEGDSGCDPGRLGGGVQRWHRCDHNLWRRCPEGTDLAGAAGQSQLGTEVRMVWERTTWAARVPDTWESRKDRTSLLHDDNGAVSMDIPCTSLITLVINIHVHNIDVNYKRSEGPIKRDYIYFLFNEDQFGIKFITFKYG